MDVGGRIRRMRLAKRLRLTDVAEKAGFSVSYLSQIENGKVDMTISTLQAIALALEANVADFLTQPKDADYSLICKEDRKYYNDNDGIKEAPLFTHDDSLLETAIIEMPPNTEITSNSTHEGEEFTFVISGAVVVLLGNESFELKEGDIIFYNSILNHRWKNKSETSCTLLVTNTPKTF